MQETLKITAVAGNKKVIKVEGDDSWWLLDDPVIKYLESGNSGVVARVTAKITYKKKTVKNEEQNFVTRIEVVKDDPKEEVKEKAKEETKSEYKSSSSSSDDRTTSIIRQSTLKAAADLLSGQDLNNSEVAAEKVVEIAKRFQKYVETGE